jgi:hypothetical protein
MNPFVLCRASRSGGEAMNSFAPLLLGPGASLALVSGASAADLPSLRAVSAPAAVRRSYLRYVLCGCAE